MRKREGRTHQCHATWLEDASQVIENMNDFGLGSPDDFFQRNTEYVDQHLALKWKK
jgi:hypothetical protein